MYSGAGSEPSVNQMAKQTSLVITAQTYGLSLFSTALWLIRHNERFSEPPYGLLAIISGISPQSTNLGPARV